MSPACGSRRAPRGGARPGPDLAAMLALVRPGELTEPAGHGQRVSGIGDRCRGQAPEPPQKQGACGRQAAENPPETQAAPRTDDPRVEGVELGRRVVPDDTVAAAAGDQSQTARPAATWEPAGRCRRPRPEIECWRPTGLGRAGRPPPPQLEHDRPRRQSLRVPPAERRPRHAGGVRSPGANAPGTTVTRSNPRPSPASVHWR
jgi:hypothetical protein